MEETNPFVVLPELTPMSDQPGTITRSIIFSLRTFHVCD